MLDVTLLRSHKGLKFIISCLQVGIFGTLLVFLVPFTLLTNYITFKSNLKYYDDNMNIKVSKWRYTLRKFTVKIFF